MPIVKRRQSQRDARFYQTELLQLRHMGVAVGRHGDISPPTTSRLEQYLRVEQIDPESATIYDLPGVAIAVVIPAKLTALRGGILITSAELTVPWDPVPLELEEPERHVFFDRVIAGLIPCPPKLLYARLTGDRNLYRGQWKGAIIGIGYISIPPQYLEHAEVPVTLSLWDEMENVSRFTFFAQVDRAYKQCYEREHAKWGSHRKRVPIFSHRAEQLPKGGIESPTAPELREPDCVTTGTADRQPTNLTAVAAQSSSTEQAERERIIRAPENQQGTSSMEEGTKSTSSAAR